VLHLEEATFTEFCGDVVMGGIKPSIRLIDPICDKALDLTPHFIPSTSHHPVSLLAYHESLGDIRGYNPSFDPYSTYLEDFLGKIIWSTFFDHTFDFSMAFDEFKRPYGKL